VCRVCGSGSRMVGVSMDSCTRGTGRSSTRSVQTSQGVVIWGLTVPYVASRWVVDLWEGLYDRRKQPQCEVEAAAVIFHCSKEILAACVAACRNIATKIQVREK
jgi:hypothetical protein